MSDSGYGHDDISCLTYDSHVDILLGSVDVCEGPLHVHFRKGVALVGKFDYWALLTPSWDPSFKYREYSGRQCSLEDTFEKKGDMWL